MFHRMYAYVDNEFIAKREPNLYRRLPVDHTSILLLVIPDISRNVDQTAILLLHSTKLPRQPNIYIHAFQRNTQRATSPEHRL